MNALTGSELVEEWELVETFLKTLFRLETVRAGRLMRAEHSALSEAVMPACYRWCQNRVYEVGTLLHPEVA